MNDEHRLDELAGRASRYQLDQKRLRELHRSGLTAAEAEEANRILTTNYRHLALIHSPTLERYGW